MPVAFELDILSFLPLHSIVSCVFNPLTEPYYSLLDMARLGGLRVVQVF